MAAYKIFTVESGGISEGAVVNKHILKGAEIEIPAIIVGEKDCGLYGALPVRLPNQLFKEWQKKESVIINTAEIVQTKTGKPNLLAKSKADTNEKIIVVFRIKIGFCGSNFYTGDRTGDMERDIFGNQHPKFRSFPGKILISEVVMHGKTGILGSGKQLVALIPKDVVFRAGYSGHLYDGRSSRAYYYKWDGQQLLTWNE